MHVLIIMHDAPYGSERPYQALRLAGAILQVDDEVELTVYLTADAVLCARKGQQTPEGYYNIERMLKPILRRGIVMTCRMCMAARGMTEEDLADGVLPTRLGDLAQLTFEADRILVY
ncbi:MAG: DsrE family protein [Planctomycetota bacterium]|nr:DsrE family protein [Planctomycetota bacterium]